MTTRLLFAAIAAGAACLALAWFMEGYLLVAAVISVSGSAWLYAAARRKRWAAALGLAGAVLAAGAADWIDSNAAAWLLPGLACALAAWDLTDFEQRLDLAARPAERPALERTHLTRLGVVLLIGLVLSEAALRLTGVRVNFEWAVVFIFIGAWGLTMLIGWLRERGM